MRSPNRVALDLPPLRAVRGGLAARALAAAALAVGLAALAGPVRADREPFARTGTPPRYARDRTVDVLHQALDVRLDFEAGSIAGTATIVFAPLNGPRG